MSEFWLVVNPVGGRNIGIETFDTEPEAVRFKSVMDGDNPTYPQCLIYHFVNGIPHDVTPGRADNAGTRIDDLVQRTAGRWGEAVDARLAKIEARLDRLEKKA